MPKVSSQAKPKAKKPVQQDGPRYNDLRYWSRRRYEHEAEVLALRKLLKDKHFKSALDVGGGYGRLSVTLKEFADNVILVEPDRRQLEVAREYLEAHRDIKREAMKTDHLKFKAGSIDLVIMIRAMHRLPDPTAEFKEIARVLSPDGYAVLEVDNFIRARNRLKFLLGGKRLPTNSVDIRSRKDRRAGKEIFINHNPHTVVRQLAHAGLKVERILSVSNLRSTGLKNVLPTDVMLAIEGVLQPTLAKTYFGPSVFFLGQKSWLAL